MNVSFFVLNEISLHKSARLYSTYTQIKPPYFFFQTLFMFFEKLQTLKNDSRLVSATTAPCINTLHIHVMGKYNAKQCYNPQLSAITACELSPASHI